MLWKCYQQLNVYIFQWSDTVFAKTDVAAHTHIYIQVYTYAIIWPIVLGMKSLWGKGFYYHYSI